jgi:hypothetical protein
MPRRRAFIFAALLGLTAVALTTCSKKTPTTPQPILSSARCSTDSTQLRFGTFGLGRGTSLTFAVANVGGDTLIVRPRSTSASFIVEDTSTVHLGHLDYVWVAVNFNPNHVGTYEGAIDLGTSLCSAIPCSGVGVVLPPMCQVSPQVLSFPPLVDLPCEFYDKTFVIQNIGDGVLSGTVSTPSVHFKVLGDPSYHLTAFQTDTFTVRFSPTTSGSLGATITTGCDPVYCSGTGQSPVCSASGTGFIDFGSVHVGQSLTQNITLSFAAGEVEVCPGYNGCADFVIHSCQTLVDPGTYTFPITFQPTTVGPETCTVVESCHYVIGSPGYTPFHCVTLIGNGTPGPGGSPLCQVSATSIDFGPVQVGHIADQTLTLTNGGGGYLNGAIPSSICPTFSCVGNGSFSLGPGESANFTIRFMPAQSGVTYTCYIFPFGPDCPTVTLFGDGQ